MPSYKQKISVDLNSNESGVLDNIKQNECTDETKRDVSPEKTSDIPAGLSTDQENAFNMRDFIQTSANSDFLVEANPSPLSFNAESFPYIDEPVETAEHLQPGSHDDHHNNKDTEMVLNNAVCRIRRWRANSRKLRRPCVVKSGEDIDRPSDCSDLVDRLRSLAVAGSMSVSAGELQTLAPPPAAATAPTSPGAFLASSLADQTSAEYFGSSPECCADILDSSSTSGAPAPPPGPRYKLVTEGALRVCCFQHTRTVMDKILSAKFLRRWETHVLMLQDYNISSKTPSGLLEKPLAYNCMQEVYCLTRWDPRKYCLRIVMPQGSLLLQANDAYTRDQWYHSIKWKRNMIRYQHTISNIARKEVAIKELKNMIDFVMTTPLQDEVVTRVPMQILTEFLSEKMEDPDWEEWAEKTTSTAAPLLAERCASGELCALLARLCRRRPRAAPLPALAPPVRRVLTRNVDFARAPHARRLVRDYISAVSAHKSGAALVRRFVDVTHGGRALCPHPRAAPNLAAVALAALDRHYRPPRHATHPHNCDDDEHEVLCFADILEHMCQYEDWLVVVSGILQPVPFCPSVLRCPRVAGRLRAVLLCLARDPRCTVHNCLAPAQTARQNPPSWLKATSPSEAVFALPHKELCQLWGDMLSSLLNCCTKKKSFLHSMSKQLPDFLLVALTEHPAALDALCHMLEWGIVSGEQTQLEIIATLQGTTLGQQYYNELCDKQQHLKRLQADGGPRQLALPVRATDADVAALLAAGALGNLECLSLAFTSVTSQCAQHLIKLPSLRYLNLWATQFGDSGVQLIAEHLPRLQVLNLCETPVSDKGIEALSALPSLRRLNLNSTKLSAEAFEVLRQRLPLLQEYDIRYTEAW